MTADRSARSEDHRGIRQSETAVSGASGEDGDLRQVCHHLTFLGYELREGDGTILASHPDQLDLLLIPRPGGVGFCSIMATTELATLRIEGLFAMIQRLNSVTTIVRYSYIGENRLLAEAEYAGTYDRQRFAAFAHTLISETLYLLTAIVNEYPGYLA